MEHKLPELPYALDALEPHISEETLQFHHGKHHASYVKKLNKLIRDTAFADKSLEEIIATADGDIFNNAAQTWNHSFYWACLSPTGGGRPQGELAKAIDSRFGGFDDFVERFNTIAKGLFGSGWVWLTLSAAGELEIEATHDAETPLRQGRQALLTCDLWEHAYYIDYRNARADYLAGFWHVVNWRHAAEQFDFVQSAKRRRA